MKPETLDLSCSCGRGHEVKRVSDIEVGIDIHVIAQLDRLFSRIGFLIDIADTNVSDVSKFSGWPLAHEFT